MKKKWVLLTALLAVLLALTGGVLVAQAESVLARVTEMGNSLPQGYGVIRVADLQVAVIERDLTLLDIREVAEYEAGHLENSFNVPIRTLGENLNLLPDLNAEIVVICKGGARAAQAGAALMFLGYTNIKILAGGFDAWAGEELPTTMEPFVVEPGTAPEIDADVFAAINAYLTNLPQGFALVSSQNLSVELVENPPVLIDVRGTEEFGKGYIEGANHIWINEFVNRLGELPEDKSTPIVVYCASGYRGGYAAVFLNMLGYTNVRNLSGGTNAWAAAGLPLAGVPFDLAGAFDAYLEGLPSTFGALRPDDLAALLDSDAEILLVDVRTPDEYSEGFIEGAINVPLNEVMSSLSMFPNLDEQIVIYCGSGHRSALVMVGLNMLGYTNVSSMMTGVGGWKTREYPLTQELVEYAGGTAPAFDPQALAVVSEFMNNIPTGYYVVRPADLSVELVENAPFLVDVRGTGEYANGYIEGAINIPLVELVDRVSELPQEKDAAIVVYDNPTHRSSIAMTYLRMAGYTNVRVLGGGTGAWTNANLPLVQ